MAEHVSDIIDDRGSDLSCDEMTPNPPKPSERLEFPVTDNKASLSGF